MKKTLVASSLATILFSLISNNASADLWNYYNPRLSIWGLAGEPDQARGDFLFPVAGNPCNLFYTDLQGSYTQRSNAWSSHDWSRQADYVSAGAGFRKLYNNSVLGAYLFYDRDESNSHNIFNVLSPGIEGFFCNWDVRLNGYFPLNPRRKINSSLEEQLNYANLINPPCSCDIARIVQQSIFFHGHNEFFHAFTIFEEPGRGGDAEIGYTFHRLRNTQVHGGVYYFNFHTPSNFRNFHNNPNNITGVEGRLETPINRFVALTAEASYDKYQRGAVVGGLRINLVPASYASCDLRSHMTDPVPRNLGTLKTGSGVPTIKSFRDDGVFLARDNLYFFNATGGSAFVNSQDSGTFDNPLAANQWTQATVDAVGPGADFVFPTGTYTNVGVGPTPNSDITLLLNDSIFGLSSSFQALPIGSDARPNFLGSFTLPGHNTISAIQVMNEGTSSGATNGNFTTINAINAPSLFFCNDNIVATNTVNGDNTVEQDAFAVQADSSQITAVNSTFTATAKVTGNNSGNLFAHDINMAIGHNHGISATGSRFDATANVGGNNTGNVNAANVGSNLTLAENAIDNNVTFNASMLNSKANVTGNNTGSVIATNIFWQNDNTLTISGGSALSSIASVGGTNSKTSTTEGVIVSNNLAMNHDNTTFINGNSTITSQAFLQGDNNNNGTVAAAAYAGINNNTANIANTQFNVTSQINGNNFSLNEAIDFTLGGTGNHTTIDTSSMNSSALVKGTENASNIALGFTSAGGNTTTIRNNSTFNTLAQVVDNGAVTPGGTSLDGVNNALSFVAGNGDIATIDNTQINTTAQAAQNGFSFLGIFFANGNNLAQGVVGLTGSTTTLTNSQLTTKAIITGNNGSTLSKTSTNQAVGLDAIGGAITMNGGFGNITAQVNGSNFGNNAGVTPSINNNFAAFAFANNGSSVSINNTSSISNVNALVGGDNTSGAANIAYGLQATDRATITANGFRANNLAQIGGDNNGFNEAFWAFANGANSTINLTNIQGVNTAEISNGSNNTSAQNLAYFLEATGGSTIKLDTFQATNINDVAGNNDGFNFSFFAHGIGSTYNISNSQSVNTTATVHGNNTTFGQNQAMVLQIIGGSHATINNLTSANASVEVVGNNTGNIDFSNLAVGYQADASSHADINNINSTVTGIVDGSNAGGTTVVVAFFSQNSGTVNSINITNSIINVNSHATGGTVIAQQDFPPGSGGAVTHTAGKNDKIFVNGVLQPPTLSTTLKNNFQQFALSPFILAPPLK